MLHARRFTFALVVIAAAIAGAPIPSHAQQDMVVATINGHAITQADLKHVESELGSELADVPQANRVQVMVEFLVQNELLATAAEAEKLGQGPAFDAKAAYYRRRALRDTYYDSKIRDSVSDAEAKAFYEQQAAAMKANPQIHARHILVEKEEDARAIRAQLMAGADFAQIAREKSRDPGSGAKGGDLGYVARGRTVKAFDETLFALKQGELSEPVKTEYGWHLIKAEEPIAMPPYEAVKTQIMSRLALQKAQTASEELRKKASITYVDPALKDAMQRIISMPAGQAGAPAPR